MKFFNLNQGAVDAPVAPKTTAASKSRHELTIAADEITDEALLEAIVGTGTSGCGGGDTRSGEVHTSIGRRHFHKHH